ncbi:hypothetical protein [Streptomyces sp. CNQ085]|uniref:hypothetical protein n=1 Tax=Streptomyces sp. CNQ085 TaxID=2886944 RepID=UPI001F506F87|nr:hypothetical protein [Streptomyces sp. CNQ085]MCI0383843.1 hypothetical protein [Streptomyces sp. CNQ085]
MKRSVKRHLKLTAVVAVVTLALSGFGQARSGGGKGGGGRGSSSKSGGGGGGCGKDKSGSRSGYSGYRSTTAGSGSSGSSSREDEPDAEIISCAKGKKGTVVELSGGDAGTYTVYVYLVDGFGDTVDVSSRRVSVERDLTRRVEVEPRDPAMVGAAEDCRASVAEG